MKKLINKIEIRDSWDALVKVRKELKKKIAVGPSGIQFMDEVIIGDEVKFMLIYRTNEDPQKKNEIQMGA